MERKVGEVFDFKGIKLQLTREPRPLPKMALNPFRDNIFDFKYDDFTLMQYNPHPHIKGEVAI